MALDLGPAVDAEEGEDGGEDVDDAHRRRDLDPAQRPNGVATMSGTWRA